MALEKGKAMADLIAIGYPDQPPRGRRRGDLGHVLGVPAMSRYGGTVLKTSLSKDDEKELQDALHGQRPA
jgi:hypothetical protein